VMIFSSQGRYLSRHLHQAIKNIIGRAIDAVAATGLDPNRYTHCWSTVDQYLWMENTTVDHFDRWSTIDQYLKSFETLTATSSSRSRSS